MLRTNWNWYTWHFIDSYYKIVMKWMSIRSLDWPIDWTIGYAISSCRGGGQTCKQMSDMISSGYRNKCTGWNGIHKSTLAQSEYFDSDWYIKCSPFLVVFTHEENDKGWPASERLASFPFAHPVVVLFPDVASPLVLFYDIVDKIAAQFGVDAAGTHLTPSSASGLWAKA